MRNGRQIRGQPAMDVAYLTLAKRRVNLPHAPEYFPRLLRMRIARDLTAENCDVTMIRRELI